jgi:predicted lipoprotein with Yx(FWY)xxD motif
MHSVVVTDTQEITMKHSAFATISTLSRSALRPAVLAALACGSIAVACVSEEDGIPTPSGAAGDSAQSEAGTPPSSAGMSGSTSVAGTSATTGGESGAPPVSEGGDAHHHPVGTAGMPDLGGVGGEPSQGGAGGAPEPQVAMSCVFHTVAPVPVEAAGGAGPVPPPADIVVQQNAFVGAYLTDAAGRTLYTYGSDLPGDCESAPVVRCEADCLVSWPIFSGGQRVLGAGLDDAAFGTLVRNDGSTHVTYYGWPLYYYKSDLTLGQLTGQGKGKTWHVAEVTPPSVMIMKAGTLKYLSDGAGRTLYVSANDTAGSSDDPVSACTDACLDAFSPFHDKKLSVVSSLEPTDFSVFVRHGKGGLQLAYKGMPLYLSHADIHAGEMHGAETSGFSAAVP